MDTKIERSAERWYPLKPIPIQLDLVKAVSEGVRFPLVPSGRRSGKSERFKRFVVKQAMGKGPVGPYFAAAPTHSQAKSIFWKDLKLLSFASTLPKRPSESELKISYPNGSELHVVGLDKPERFEGIPWKGGGIDEIANVKAKAWQENILPALNTKLPSDPYWRAWCWLLGVPDGLNHYYDLCEKAETGDDPNFKVFHWKSSEVLDPEVLESMRNAMGPRQFRQEFEASFESALGRIYEDYGKRNHTSETIKPDEKIHWMHDQNYTPLSSAIGVVRNQGKDLYLLDEIVLTSAVSRQSAVEFVERYKDHKNKSVVIYGDPAGKQGEKHGHSSDYTEIEDVLRAHKWEYVRKVKKAAPAIKDRQNAVRAKILTASGKTSLFVNPATAKWCHKGLSVTQYKEGSTFQEEQKDNDYQHITTAIGYCVDRLWPIRRELSGMSMGYDV